MEYSKAFHNNNGKGSRADFYNAACSWALVNYPDSAFRYLNLCVAMDYSAYEHISKDKDLTSIQNVSRDF